MAKWVYKFHEGSAAMRNLLGGKGCNLAEMTNLGMPIPQGFTVTTEACTEYYNCGKQISQEIRTRFLRQLPGWKDQWQEVRRYRGSVTSFRTFRRTGVHAWYDGYNPEPGIKRRCS